MHSHPHPYPIFPPHKFLLYINSLVFILLVCSQKVAWNFFSKESALKASCLPFHKCDFFDIRHEGINLVNYLK